MTYSHNIATLKFWKGDYLLYCYNCLRCELAEKSTPIANFVMKSLDHPVCTKVMNKNLALNSPLQLLLLRMVLQ